MKDLVFTTKQREKSLNFELFVLNQYKFQFLFPMGLMTVALKYIKKLNKKHGNKNK